MSSDIKLISLRMRFWIQSVDRRYPYKETPQLMKSDPINGNFVQQQ